MAFIGTIFTSTYHTKELNPWPNSSARCVVNYSWLSACQGDMKPFEALMDVWQTSETSHNKSSSGYQYLPEVLVTVYSFCLMVKSVSCCCVRESRHFSNHVTFLPIAWGFCKPLTYHSKSQLGPCSIIFSISQKGMEILLNNNLVAWLLHQHPCT